MEAYRRNIDILITNDDREMAEKETLIFNELIDKFKHFYQDELFEEENQELSDDPDMTDTLSISDTTAIGTTETEEVLDTMAVLEKN